ncbi:SF1B family DNA helicase RecD2 [Lachnoclostridium phytofermentans]|uniref:ATP-dependent RecD2 DNA helicase n=1 Tax=Lachnoclostridium phytofermentans (strain ATCC 700394 / DSM 18823 / ISDg) TaxID=357809 RepID=A9KS02_LACP7|nr:ATP-dependent RecD-like DNA helicase [Lachnoclostridium phytofermentans]ABX40633.1 helicase, RecD/TraA family [Lachnoclostridium phytofermentans ISDg]
MAEELKGYVERIVYRNAENGYTVLSLSAEEDEVTCVGTFSFVNEGEYLSLTGSYTAHPLYGEQFQVSSYEMKEPEDLLSIERYLGSGAIKGVGTALAARIVRKFKEKTFVIIEEEPERLSEVKGISDKLAREIYRQFSEKREMRSAMLFLQQYGISLNLAVKIYKQYGERMYEVIKENPYRLAEDISGVGFKIADEIASRIGIRTDSDYRVKAGILYNLLLASGNGHVYLPMHSLVGKTCEMLMVEADTVKRHITSLALEKKLVVKESGEEQHVYSTSFYYMELNVANMLSDLSISYDISPAQVETRLAKIEQETNLELDEMQRYAVMEAVRSGLLIITGGPGTGKTTTINTILRFFEAEGMDMLLAAPTGRAAKRMKETTGYEASTIHRLLELTKGMDDKDGRMSFERNELNPLEADVIIIDEMSMVDISLMHSLLKAITVGTRIILVGDVNQLPSVGPGNVLRDMIESKAFPVVMLKKIFRQASESDIIVNAHKINSGEHITLDNKSKDFFLLKRDDVNVIISVIISLVRDKMPKYVNASVYDIQVLTPMRKGELGVERLNQVLQQYLNPSSQEKKEKEHFGGIFREGDKVMQVKNNYQIAWETKSRYGITIDSGTGVFNGDTGVIKEINLFAEELTVEFDEGRLVTYPFSQLEELELAYAVTIHKSQGSEYPAVVLPIYSGPRMLFNRNLLYTAVTRAKQCVTIVGSDNMVQSMIDNESELKRYSGLQSRIMERKQILS